ncbi:hypothetical protein [Devosia sp. FJ2-5-3]|uniref:hypothetical protein n=1 Tax=Devosia sp. FJ2-5-3 TaxID=2976680 RepID=UPI0023D85D07|nr:hypothetical protein [Devosia sp. FJ2-5-3]WEJ57711.1 hypothetical protein N0P34_16140 [Devosia sp. FJ2-5-3]
MISDETVTLEFLSRQQAQLLDELRAVRIESREIRRSFTLISEHFSRQEHRIVELRDDLETLVKLELGGAIANLETRLETALEGRLDGYVSRLDGVELRLERLDEKLDAILAAVTPR